MKLGFFVSYFLLVFTVSAYGVTLPSESYVSPYSSPEKTSIWGSAVDPNNTPYESVTESSSSMMRAPGDHGPLIWCPYCVGLWGYVDSDDYMACIESPEAEAACTDPDCEVHGDAVEVPLPISNSIMPLLLFASLYAIVRLRKLRTLKKEQSI